MSMIYSTSCQTDDVDKDIVDAEGDEEVQYGEDSEISVKADLSVAVHEDKYIPVGDIVITVENKETNEVFDVDAYHSVVDGCSTFTFAEPMPVGEYTTLYVSYDIEETKGDDASDAARDKYIYTRIEYFINKYTSYTFPDDFNTNTWNLGSGTVDDPILVSHGIDLLIIDDLRRTTDTYTTAGYFYEQTQDIDLSLLSSFDGGFEGVCSDETTPFEGHYDGKGFTISGMVIKRFADGNKDTEPTQFTSAAGLFCYVSNAIIKNLTIENPYIIGYDGVGAIVGAALSLAAEASTATYLENCHVVNSMDIYGRQFVGGLVGGADNGAALMLYNCSNSVTDSGSSLSTRGFVMSTDSSVEDTPSGYIGGLVGGAAASESGSTINIINCSNSMAITTASGVAIGGLVGSSHEVYIANSKNTGAISASEALLGCGGLIGGCTRATILSSINDANVSAPKACGVGGVIGTTLYDYTTVTNDANEEQKTPRFGNAAITSTHNYGDVSAASYVGGIAGGAQLRTTHCFNSGSVSGADYSGGLAGYAAVLTSTYSTNSGAINGTMSGGLVGEVNFYWVIASNNIGAISGTDSAGGLIGRGGRCGAINYSNNFGSVTGAYPEYTGGIAGQLGNKFDSGYVIGENLDDVAALIKKTLVKVIKSKIKAPSKLSDFIAEVKEFKEEVEVAKGAIESFRDFFEVIDVATSGTSEDYSSYILSPDTFDSETQAGCVANDATMSQLIKSYTSVIYTGSIPTTYNPAELSLLNTIYLAENTINDSDEMNYMVGNISDELESLEKKQLVSSAVKEFVLKFTETIVGLCKLSSGPVMKFVLGVAEIGLDSLGETIPGEDDTNAISVSQVTNFGKTNGYGIIGSSGYYLQLRHAVSAASVGGSNYGAAENESHQHVSIDYVLCVGDANVDASSRIDSSDKDNSVLAYGTDSGYTSAADFTSTSIYSDYGFSITTSDSYNASARWCLTSGYPFALPNSNRYMDN